MLFNLDTCASWVCGWDWFFMIVALHAGDLGFTVAWVWLLTFCDEFGC